MLTFTLTKPQWLKQLTTRLWLRQNAAHKLTEAAFAWFETVWETEQLQDFLYFFPSDDYNSN